MFPEPEHYRLEFSRRDDKLKRESSWYAVTVANTTYAMGEAKALDFLGQVAAALGYTVTRSVDVVNGEPWITNAS